MSASITAIILTYNESIHIERCVNSISNFVDDIVVVDSYSTDDTIEIARRMGIRVFQNTFVHQAQQFNWALENCNINTDWIWRIDADEYIDFKLGEDVRTTIGTCDSEVNGIYVNKKIVFLGKPLLHGGWYPAQQIKIIRRGCGKSENKPMDEHLIITSGRTVSIDGDQTDENLRGLSWWIDKHNKYADREVDVMLMMSYEMDENKDGVEAKFWGNGAERKRWLKLRYANMPLYIRPFLNFFVRYVLQGGFLDGNHRWYILQGFWYRYLVDSKIYELKKRFNFDDERIRQYLENKYMNRNEKTDDVTSKVRGGNLLICKMLCSSLSFIERRVYAA